MYVKNGTHKNRRCGRWPLLNPIQSAFHLPKQWVHENLEQCSSRLEGDPSLRFAFEDIWHVKQPLILGCDPTRWAPTSYKWSYNPYTKGYNTS